MRLLIKNNQSMKLYAWGLISLMVYPSFGNSQTFELGRSSLQAVKSFQEIEMNQTPDIQIDAKETSEGFLGQGALSQSSESLLPLPDGWTRATSNPNYGIRVLQEDFGSGLRGERLKILDLRTNEEEDIHSEILYGRYFNQLGEFKDISPNEKIVLGEIINYRDESSILVYRRDLPNEKIYVGIKKESVLEVEYSEEEVLIKTEGEGEGGYIQTFQYKVNLVTGDFSRELAPSSREHLKAQLRNDLESTGISDLDIFPKVGFGLMNGGTALPPYGSRTDGSVALKFDHNFSGVALSFEDFGTPDIIETADWSALEPIRFEASSTHHEIKVEIEDIHGAKAIAYLTDVKKGIQIWEKKLSEFEIVKDFRPEQMDFSQVKFINFVVEHNDPGEFFVRVNPETRQRPLFEPQDQLSSLGESGLSEFPKVGYELMNGGVSLPPVGNETRGEIAFQFEEELSGIGLTYDDFSTSEVETTDWSEFDEILYEASSTHSELKIEIEDVHGAKAYVILSEVMENLQVWQISKENFVLYEPHTEIDFSQIRFNHVIVEHNESGEFFIRFQPQVIPAGNWSSIRNNDHFFYREKLNESGYRTHLEFLNLETSETYEIPFRGRSEILDMVMAHHEKYATVTTQNVDTDPIIKHLHLETGASFGRAVPSNSDFMSGGYQDGVGYLYIMNLRTGEAHYLGQTSAYSSKYVNDVSPDGRWVLTTSSSRANPASFSVLKNLETGEIVSVGDFARNIQFDAESTMLTALVSADFTPYHFGSILSAHISINLGSGEKSILNYEIGEPRYEGEYQGIQKGDYLIYAVYDSLYLFDASLGIKNMQLLRSFNIREIFEVVGSSVAIAFEDYEAHQDRYLKLIVEVDGIQEEKWVDIETGEVVPGPHEEPFPRASLIEAFYREKNLPALNFSERVEVEEFDGEVFIRIKDTDAGYKDAIVFHEIAGEWKMISFKRRNMIGNSFVYRLRQEFHVDGIRSLSDEWFYYSTGRPERRLFQTWNELGQQLVYYQRNYYHFGRSRVRNANRGNRSIQFQSRPVYQSQRWGRSRRG